MGAKFINTKYNETVDKLIDSDIKKFNNPYYTFTDKKPTPVDYYLINQTHTTLDEASKLAWGLVGEDSPIKFNLIKDAYLYGIEKILVQYGNEEWGLEADTIEGEAYVLPNTFKPTPGDHFRINYLKEPVLFKVTAVTIDTLDTGANFYKISYKLDQTDVSVIKDDHIVEEFKMIVNNIGTQFKAVVESTTYDLIEQLELHTSTLKKYFTSLFYNDRVQTFVFNWNGTHFYDPFMIEFIMRNKILTNNEDYIFIDHATFTLPSFAIDYDRCFFKGLEEKDINKFIDDDKFIAEQVMDINSLMNTQYDKYYSIQHRAPQAAKLERIHLLDYDFTHKLSVGDRFSKQDKKEFYNMIIKYFDNERLNGHDLELLNKISYIDSKDLFYIIPMMIYIVEDDIKNMLR